MSSYLFAKAIRTRTTTGTTRLILLILTDLADEAGRINIPIADLAARANCHRTTMRRGLEELGELGIWRADETPKDVLAGSLALDEPLFEVDGVAFAEPEGDWDDTVCIRDGGISTDLLWLGESAGEAQEFDDHQIDLAFRTQSLDSLMAQTKALTIDATKNPQYQVGALIAAANIEVDPLKPLYWMRAEHSADLQALLTTVRMTFDQLTAFLSDRQIRPGPIKRLTDLAPVIKREQSAP